jgi:hypothetical protein
MGSPFKMKPGSKSGASRDRGLMQMAQRGLIAGGPKTHEGGKVHDDARSGDKLPSYEVKSSKHSASLGSGSEGKSSYTPPKRTAEGDAAYAALTPEKRKAQDAAYIAKNTKPASSGGSSSVDSSKEIALGDKTLNQVKKDAQNTADNRVSYQEAKDEKEKQLQIRDSSDAANKYLKLQVDKKGPEIMQGEKGDLYRELAQKLGDKRAVAGTVARRNEKRQRGKAQSIQQYYTVGADEKSRIEQSVKENVSAKPKG